MKIVGYSSIGEINSIIHIFSSEYEFLNEQNHLLIPEDVEVTFDNHWVNEGEITLRPDSPIQLEEYMLKNIPEGSVLTINNNIRIIVNEPIVKLELEENSTYSIHIKAFPYKDFTTEIIT